MPSDLAQRLGTTAAQFEPQEYPPKRVSFEGWAPDLPDLYDGKSNKAENVIPQMGSMLPVPSPVEISPELNGRCYHGISGKDNAGNAYSYAATADKLYDVRPDSVTDKSSMAYTTTDTGAWDATQFGDKIIFTNYVNPVQGILAGDAGNFTDLFTSTSKPNARWCATVRNFLVLGDVSDEDGPTSNRVRWSGINNPTDMDPDAQTQSDYEDIQSGGAIQRIVGGGDYGVIVQENQISRMSYTGDATVWRFDPIDKKRGSPIPKSVIGHGRNTFFIAEEGFFQFTGTESVPIGEDKVDDTFWAEFDSSNAHRVSSTMSFNLKLAAWLFPGNGSTGGNPNKIWVYHWHDKKWAEILLDLEQLTQSLTQGYTLEELDSVSTNLDLLPYSLDDPIWQGGALRLGAYTRFNRLAHFTGPALEATIDTNEFQMFGGRQAFIDFIRPLVDGAEVFCNIGGRNTLSTGFDSSSMGGAGARSYGSDVPQNADGLCPVDSNFRYQRIRTRIPEGGRWSHAQGVEVYGRPVGSF